MDKKKRKAIKVRNKAISIYKKNKTIPNVGDYFFEEIPKLKNKLAEVKNCFFDIEMLFTKNEIKCNSIKTLSKLYSDFYLNKLTEITEQDFDLHTYNENHNKKDPKESYGFMLFSNRDFLLKTYYKIDEYLKKLYILIYDTIVEYNTGNVEQVENRISKNYKKLSGKLINTLALNSDAYIEAFTIENYLRAYILVKYKSKFGNESLFELFKNCKKVQEKAISRKEEDDKNGWTEPRGKTLLSYLDFDELKKIIIQNDNWSIFEKDFPNQDFLRIRVQELYQVRNKVAHNANVTQEEFNLLKMYSNQIITQLKIYNDDIKIVEL